MDIKKPLVIFDLETTGTDISKDRIIQIGWIKIGVGGEVEEEENILVNPGIPISPAATAVHGITDSDVAGAPEFKEIARRIALSFDGADLGGFNIKRFDIPLLAEEMLRAGVPFSLEGRKVIDAFIIYQKMNPRNLAAAYKEYTGKDAEDAHDALADAKMTSEIIVRQIEAHGELEGTVDGAASYSSYGDELSMCGKFKLEEDGWKFTFGKHKNKRVLDNEDYLGWMLGADFPEITKAHIKMMLGISSEETVTDEYDDLPF